MGRIFYWITVQLYKFAVWSAKSFNRKARQMWIGRKGQWTVISQKTEGLQGPVLWMHCASLGEFEQGRPVLEEIRKHYPRWKIVVTFFSPSGFEVRRNYSGADAVFYLPFDSARNARKFIALVKPQLVFFVKYEFWYYYLRELEKKNVPALSISAIFRPGQLFFKPYGTFYKKLLNRFDHIFVQNKRSKELLNTIGLLKVSLSGDTRFDRVYQITRNPVHISIAEKFRGDAQVFVIGSSWPNDIEMPFPFINRWKGKLKFIIAPHELSQKNFQQIERLVNGRTVRYSQANPDEVGTYDVLLIDNIGMLSSLYSYGRYAYIGGAFDHGLHNTLEAAAYGIPVFFGKGRKNIKYKEAIELIGKGAAFEIGNEMEMEEKMSVLYSTSDRWKEVASAAEQYVLDNLGATDCIISYAEKYLRNYE